MNQLALEQLVAAIAGEVAARVTSELAEMLATSQGATSPWMNIDSAASYLDLPKQRLYKLTAHGAIPHHKQDGRLLFHRAELDEWMTQFRQPGDWIFSDNRAISP